MATLLMLTQAFPFGSLTERSFVLPEIESLCKHFDRVVIIPMTAPEGDVAVLPPNAETSRCVADSPMMLRKWLRLMLVAKAPAGWLADSPHYALAATAVANEILQFIRESRLSAADTVAYSFWFDFPASALAIVKRKTGIRFISRGHGYDLLIDDAHRIRQATIAESEGLQVVSHAGARRMKSLFPTVAAKIGTSYLGVRIPNGNADLDADPAPQIATRQSAPHHSSPAPWHFVSCSRIVPLKRVDMNIRFMHALAAEWPSHQFAYTHIGGSPEEICKLYNPFNPPNLTIRFAGELPNASVLDLFNSGAYHWFMLLSETEGLPVAMMEAMAAGIPPVVTDVGGVSEAAADYGILLTPEPTEQEFLAKIRPYMEDPALRNEFCTKARQRIRSRFDSKILRNDFARHLRSLI